MLGINTQSLVLTIFLGYLLSAIIYILYVILYKSTETFIKLYILGRLLQCIPWIIYSIFPDQLNYIPMAIGNLFLYSGFAIELYCLVGINSGYLKKLKISLSILTVLNIIIYAIFSKNVITRVIVSSVFYSILFSFIFIRLSLKKSTTKMQTIIGWIALIFALVNLVKGSYSLLYKVEIPVYTNIPIQIILGIIWLIIAYVFPLLFLFVIKEQDNDKLKALVLTKDRFFKIIGHDLKSPIGQIIQISQLIEENYRDMRDEELVSIIKTLRITSERGFKLLENLLEWARSQTKDISFSPEPLSIYELIKEIIEQHEKQAEDKNIRIITSNIYHGTITADKNMINTIVRNLLSNAIKFTRFNGLIEINNKIDKDFLTISIKDNGVGISKADCEKLFRFDSGITTNGTNNEKGTGIGLILCKEFIDKHNGKIWVESEVEKGSTFSFKIPLK